MKGLKDFISKNIVDLGGDEPQPQPVTAAPQQMRSPTLEPSQPWSHGLNADMMANLQKAINSRRSAYTELLGVVSTLTMIPDERLRTQAAFATMRGTRTIQDIAAALDVHMSDMDGEKQRFALASERQVATEVTARQQQARTMTEACASTRQRIAELTAEIERLSASIADQERQAASLEQEAQQEQAKIAQVVRDFNAAVDATKQQLAAYKASFPSLLA